MDIDGMLKKMMGKGKKGNSDSYPNFSNFNMMGKTDSYPNMINTARTVSPKPASMKLQIWSNKSSPKSASLAMQKQWFSMPPKTKQKMRMRFPDTDGDGVPDRWDCQPMNPFRQEAAWKKVPTPAEPMVYDYGGKRRLKLKDLYPTVMKKGNDRFIEAKGQWLDENIQEAQKRTQENAIERASGKAFHTKGRIRGREETQRLFAIKRDTMDINRLGAAFTDYPEITHREKIGGEALQYSMPPVGASIEKQQEWKEMPEQEKAVAQEVLPDKDGDSVPDCYDCEPENSEKQDSQVYLSYKDLRTPQEFKSRNKFLKSYSGPRKGNSAFVQPNRYPNKTFLTSTMKDIDFNDPKNIAFLSNLLQHEEMHHTLNAIKSNKDLREGSRASKELDNLTIPVYHVGPKHRVVNPYASLQIDIPARKEMFDKYNEEGPMKPTIQKYEEKYNPQGASIEKQQEWKEIPEQGKETVRAVLPDKDGDGVPDCYDCQPENAEKQDSQGYVGKGKWKRFNANLPHVYSQSTITDEAEKEYKIKHNMIHLSKQELEDRERYRKQIENSGRPKITTYGKRQISDIDRQLDQSYMKTYDIHMTKDIPPQNIKVQDVEKVRQKAYKQINYPNIYERGTYTYGGHKSSRESRVREEKPEVLQSLPPASIEKQQEWKEMPEQEKAVAQEVLPDKDGDSVPDCYDCEPENPKKDSQIYLDPYKMNITEKQLNRREYGGTVSRFKRELDEARYGNTMFVEPKRLPEKIFVGDTFKNTDFSKEENIKGLANTLGHEELHHVLYRDIDKSNRNTEATSGLDKVSIPIFLNAKSDIENPHSSFNIDIPARNKYQEIRKDVNTVDLVKREEFLKEHEEKYNPQDVEVQKEEETKEE